MQKEYRVQSNESIYDVSVKLYGSIDYVFKISNDNNISLTTDIYNLTLIYDDSISKQTPSQINVNTIKVNTLTATVGVMEKQSIYDIAMQTMGSFENIVSFCLLNSIGIQSNIEKKNLVYEKAKIVNNNITKYFVNKGLYLGTRFVGSVTSNEPRYCSFNRSFNKSFRICTKSNHYSFNDSFNESFL